MHRLMPWLNRELLCLNTDQPQPISYVVQRIDTLIQTYDMTSHDFASRIRALVPNHTDHFIHELINYARSPYDLVGYDRFVTYTPRFESETNDVVTLSSSEEGSDVEFVGPVLGPVVEIESGDVINVVTNQNTSSNDNDNRSNSNSNRNDSIEQPGASTSGVSTVTATSSAAAPSQQQTIDQMTPAPDLSGDDSDEEEIKNYLRHKPNVSTEEMIRGRTGPTPPLLLPPLPVVINAESTPSNSNNNNINNNNSSQKSDFDSERTIIIAPNNVQTNDGASTSQAVTAPEIVPKIEPNTNTKSTPQEVIDADSGSDSDECLFVCAKKPPHLRTPEYVELNSDSDSDVVFVSSQTPMTEITNSHLEAAANDVRKSILDVLSAHCSETSTNLRRKRVRNTTDTNSTTYTTQNASSSVYEAKPSTSEAMLQWLIQSPDEHSRRISPRCKLNLNQSF